MLASVVLLFSEVGIRRVISMCMLFSVEEARISLHFVRRAVSLFLPHSESSCCSLFYIFCDCFVDPFQLSELVWL